MKKLLWFVLSVSTVFGCTYSPEDKYFVKVTPKAPGSVALNISDFKDTIYLFQPAQISFSISGVSSLTESDVLIGDNTIYQGTESSGTFSIDGSNFKTGVSILKIEYNGSSASGSLADVEGVETSQVFKTWVLVIDADPPPAPNFITSIENGFLKISWQPFLKRSFVSYTVFSNYSTTHIIKDPHQSYFVDSTFLGSGPSTYEVTTQTPINTSSSQQQVVGDPVTSTIVYEPLDSTVTFTWRKARYFSSVKDVTLSENQTVLATITDLTDTTAKFKLKDVTFGRPLALEIDMNPKYLGDQYRNDINLPNPIATQKIGASGALSYNAYFNAIMAQNGSHFTMLDANLNVSLDITTPVTTNYRLPYPGNIVYYGTNNQLSKFDLTTYQTQTIQLPLYYENTVITAAANTGLVVFYSPGEFGFSGYSGIADFTSNGIDVYGSPFYIFSSDGKYAYNPDNKSVYQVSGSTTNLIGVVPGNAPNFREDNSDELILAGFPTVILKTSDLSILRTITPPAGTANGGVYDVATKNLVYEDYSDNIYLINIDTQSMKTIHAFLAQYLAGYLISESDNTFVKIP